MNGRQLMEMLGELSDLDRDLPVEMASGSEVEQVKIIQTGRGRIIELWPAGGLRRA